MGRNDVCIYEYIDPIKINFIDFVVLTQAVHSGADLESAVAICMGYSAEVIARRRRDCFVSTNDVYPQLVQCKAEVVVIN